MRHERPRGGDLLGPLGRVHVDDPHVRQVEPVEQLGVLAVDQDHLAVRTAYVGEQRVPATGRVQAAEDVAAQGRRGHRPQHVGGVPEQDADVQRAVRVGDRDDRGGLPRRVGQVVAPGPRHVAVEDTDVVVLEPLPEELLHRLRRHQAGSAASVLPMLSACSVAPPCRNSNRLALVK